MRKQNLFTIAPHAPFLKILAKKTLDGTLLQDWDLSKAFALSDITIILPTSRARLALAQEFTNLLGGATLLPDIRVFGGQSEEEEPFLPPFDAPDFTPAISNMKRRLVLSSLIEKWLKANNKNSNSSSSEVLSLADSLTELIDAIHIEQIDSRNLKNIAPENLSTYWQETLKFLDIALSAWPKILKEFGRIDASDLRNLQLKRQASVLDQSFIDRPVIAAGSTGSIPATANLLKSIAKLPRGVIVLPGLDISLSKVEFNDLNDKTKNPHTHPQYGLAQLLSRLGELPDSFVELAKTPQNSRTKIISHAFALAKDTSAWVKNRELIKSEISKALKNLQIIEAKNDEEQARSIALATFSSIIDKKTVGIVCPDRNLARRIISELKRFNIDVDDSAGTPLFQTRGGRLVRQILALVASDFSSLDLVAFLRNKFVSFNYQRAQIAHITDLLEYAILREQSSNMGIKSIKKHIEANVAGKNKYANIRLSEQQANIINQLLDRLENGLSPLVELFKQKTFSSFQLATALNIVIKEITKLNEQASESQRDKIAQDLLPIYNWLEEIKASGDSCGPTLIKSSIEKTIIALMANNNIRSARSVNHDVAIWGQLEARLQNREIVILAGLNETIWPKIADPGAWLSRNMTISAGLEPAERRLGQAAHDFANAMGNENIIISYSKNIGTSPAQISRFLLRLTAFIGEEQTSISLKHGEKWLGLARKIDSVKQVKPATRPNPIPPISKRPKSLSITEIEKLIRSPYDIYAKHILRLKQLEPLGQEPSVRERGNIIHAIFERFIGENIDITATDALEQLLAIAAQEFSVLRDMPEREILWFERFKDVAQEFILYEQKQAKEITKSYAEISGSWTFPINNEQFTLRGKVDRIDLLTNGQVQIIDYKTGLVPANKDMQNFLAPQLLLEGKMLQMGAFENIPSLKTSDLKISALKYIKLGTIPKLFEVTDFLTAKDSDLESAMEEISIRLSKHVAAILLDEKMPMSARILPNLKQSYVGEYEHLARTNEWSIVNGEEDMLNE